MRRNKTRIMNNEHEQQVTELLSSIRREKAREVEMIDKAERWMRLLPLDICEKLAFTSLWVQVCGPSREQVEILLSTLNAGKWEKKPCNDDKLEYNGFVDGVLIVIYNAEPPASCRIVEEEVIVPEHTETRRKLVCK